MTTISLFTGTPEQWNEYVLHHPDAAVYHHYAFKTTVEKTYGHNACYLAATNDAKIVGVLPLFHFKSLFLGNALVSLPFCDYGGLLADSPEIAEEIFQKALNLAAELGCSYCELRQTTTITLSEASLQKAKTAVATDKVRMAVALPATEEELFSSFPAKLRSQIRKPQKEGCSPKSGGIELLDDFYNVFTYNMRDLGSPVHSKKMIRNMLESFGDAARLFVIYHESHPVACSFTTGFGDTLYNPWASFKRPYQRIAPNMMLYWEMLRYAVANGYRTYDFGRSTADEGTYKFKQQWGAKPQQLYWYRTGSRGTTDTATGTIDSRKKQLFIKYWRMVPLPITAAIGPVLRRHLHL